MRLLRGIAAHWRANSIYVKGGWEKTKQAPVSELECSVTIFMLNQWESFSYVPYRIIPVKLGVGLK